MVVLITKGAIFHWWLVAKEKVVFRSNWTVTWKRWDWHSLGSPSMIQIFQIRNGRIHKIRGGKKKKWKAAQDARVSGVFQKTQKRKKEGSLADLRRVSSVVVGLRPLKGVCSRGGTMKFMLKLSFYYKFNRFCLYYIVRMAPHRATRIENLM